MSIQNEAEIRSLIESWRLAVRDKNIDQLIQFYAEDIVVFDVVDALQFKGREAYRCHWQRCFEHTGVGNFEFIQLEVSAGDTSGFAHWLADCGGHDEEGKVSCWIRMTACFQLKGDQWKTVHEHWSAPFDFADGSALINLKP